MANNDKIIGAIMAVIGAVLIILEFIVLIIRPAGKDLILRSFPKAQYWALAIPTFIAIFGVLGIIIWIGITMVQTPPPEEWEFDDIDDEFDDSIAYEDDDLDEVEEDKPEKAGGSDLKITDIKGVGASTADDLAAAGFDTVEKIASASVDDLTKIKGVGKASAQKYINNAKNIL